MVFENSIFPITSEVNSVDHLVLGGCDVTDLMEEFGSPLYVYDEVTLRSMCKEFVSELILSKATCSLDNFTSSLKSAFSA